MAFRSLPPVEFLRECFDLNEKTGDLTWKVRPRNHFKATGSHNAYTTRWPGKKVGNADKDGYLIVELAWQGRRQRIRLHRIVWKILTGEDYTGELDHRNNCKTDNRPSNLRKATKSMNMSNTTIKPQSFPYRGISKRNDTSFRAHTEMCSPRFHLGCYGTPEQAHAAYCLAVLYFKKEFANFGLNSCFPDFPLTKEFVSKVRGYINKAEQKLLTGEQQ